MLCLLRLARLARILRISFRTRACDDLERQVGRNAFCNVYIDIGVHYAPRLRDRRLVADR